MPNADNGAKMLDAEYERKPRLEAPTTHLADVLELHVKGLPSGESTGWTSLDKHYTVLPGQMTIVTGWPGSGKSEFIDALLINLSRKDWKFAIFSFENQPVSFHITKMIEKLAGKPFGLGRTDRIKEDELNDLVCKLAKSFSFTSCTSGSFTLKDVLDAAQVHLEQFPDSRRGVVIDPWNEVEHSRPSGLSETEYISHSLSRIRNWARNNRVHVWIIAHPQKVRRADDGKLPVPRPDMISGSQHWWNKADCALTVWRDNEEPMSPEVQIHVQKIRFKHVGMVGMAVLHYDRVTGKYSDPEEA